MVIHDNKFPTYRKILRAGWSGVSRIFRSRIIRAIFNWRNARRALLTVAILVTLDTAFNLEELWRGRRAWEAYRRDFEAQGGTLDLQKLTPPPVPDDQNFAMTPLLKPLFSEVSPEQYTKYSEELGPRLDLTDKEGNHLNDSSQPVSGSWTLGLPVDLQAWRKYLGQPELLQALKKFDPVLDEISLTSRRPYYRPPMVDGRSTRTLSVELPIFISLPRIYLVRALAELAAGQTERAADDTITIFQLAKAMTEEPRMLSQLTSQTNVMEGLQVLWEGLVAHRWSDAQLVDFSRELEKFDYLEAVVRSECFEQAYYDDGLARNLSGPALDRWFKVGPEEHQWQYNLVEAFFPRGWIYSDRIALLQNYRKSMAIVDVQHHRLDLEKLKAADGNPVQERFTDRKLFDDPLKIFVANLNTGLSGIIRLFSANQACLDEAQVACALERFRLVHGQLPENLDELVPKFIGKLPTDIVSGGPLHYQRNADGHFLLYEVGWNGKNDGGVVVMQGGAPDTEKSDWVWPDAVKQP